MKKGLPVGLSVLIALVLVAFGVLYGTANGYQEERSAVTELFAAENGLRDVLHYRAADGLNLCVVAQRHLGEEHELVEQLERTARSLQSAAEPQLCFQLDDGMDALAHAVMREMSIPRSFQMSERDQRYLDMLKADLDSLSASAAASGYNQAAQDFNRKLDAPLLGGLAKLLGMRPFPLYGGVK